MTQVIASQKNLRLGADHLVANDPILAPLIKRVGLPNLKPHTDYYSALVNSIIGQQVSVQSAAAVKKRLLDLFAGQLPQPAQILATTEEELRAIGFSRQKNSYVRDLAEHIVDGRITFERLAQQSNDEIIAELTDVKGIGVWTVHMFLMFCVGRLDVLPTGDLGVRNGIRDLYNFEDVPTPQQVTEISKKNNWHPYESVASWYVWRSVDANPVL